MRRAARVDGNHHDVVRALRQLGAEAIYLREPVDLLVGFRGINLLLEVKDGSLPPSERALTAKEAEFVATWPGQRAVVLSSEEAVSVVVEAARPRVVHCPRCEMPVNLRVLPAVPGGIPPDLTSETASEGRTIPTGKP